MLKYLKADIVFTEIPTEMSYAVQFSGCTLRCSGCHSRELWEDKGTYFTKETIDAILKENTGITCLLLMGGEHDIDTLIRLFMYAHQRIKTAWYCGLDMIPKDKLGILNHLDYVKVGRFDFDLGPLNEPTTNQRFYKIEKGKLYDCTSLFWR